MKSKEPHWRVSLTPYGWFLAIAGLVGAGSVLFSTSLHGVGLGNDSVSYIGAARSLLSGEGFVMFDDTAFSAWPPLFPLLIALFSSLGIEPATTGRLLNTLCHALIVILSGRIMLTVTSSKLLAVLGTLAVLTSLALHSVMIEMVTEPLFCLLIVAILWKLPSLSEKPRVAPLLLVSSLAALACLQRYMGVTIVLTGFLLILWMYFRSSRLTALRYSTIFGAISVFPVGLWVIRNYMQTSTLTGVRAAQESTISDHIAITFHMVTGWFVPLRVGTELRLILVLGIIALALTLIWYNRRRDNQSERFSKRQLTITTLLLFAVVYTVTLLFVFGRSVQIETINDRFLSPLIVPIIALIVALVSGVVEWLDLRSPRVKLLRYLVIGLFGTWLIYPTISLTEAMSHMASTGTNGYSIPHWQHSPLIEVLKDRPPSGQIYSNCPQAVSILADLPARLSSYRVKGFAGRNDVAPPETGDYLVWFEPGVHWSKENVRLNALETPKEISSRWILEIVAEASDGSIYVLRDLPIEDELVDEKIPKAGFKK